MSDDLVDFLGKIRNIQGLMARVSTGEADRSEKEKEYNSLYQDLKKYFSKFNMPNPNPFSSLEEFYGYYHARFPHWQERRDFIKRMYGTIERSLESAPENPNVIMHDKQTETARSLLYDLENRLRVFVGSKIALDYKGIKGSILKSWQSAQRKENMPWRKPVTYGLIYYSNFDELRIIITQSENWSKIFQKHFGRPEGIISRLTELDSIRDTIAHNRIISSFDFESFKHLYEQILRCMEEK
jgi:hypothetical protein